MSSKKFSLLSIYGLSLSLALIVLATVGVLKGTSVMLPVAVLAILEMTFSFDNAVLNSQILIRMNKFWQKIFLTIGIAIAVFGVRLLLPLVLVAATTNNSISGVLNLALNHPDKYSHSLETGYPLIAAFGGTFLMMIGLRFFGEKRKLRWIHQVEGPVGDFNQPWWFVFLGAISILGLIWFVLAPGQIGPVYSSMLGSLAFIVVKGVDELLTRFTPKKSKKKVGGFPAFTLFMYLELLDASFSFDSVVAAFAITKDIVLISAGLGIGAIFVRSMTIHLMQKGTVSKFKFVIHGAHYVVLLLGTLMLFSIKIHLPETITSLVGVFILSLSVISSIKYEKRLRQKTR